MGGQELPEDWALTLSPQPKLSVVTRMSSLHCRGQFYLRHERLRAPVLIKILPFLFLVHNALLLNSH